MNQKQHESNRASTKKILFAYQKGHEPKRAQIKKSTNKKEDEQKRA